MDDTPLDDPIETLMIGVRADTAAFAQDAAQMQASLQGSLGSGADRAGTLIEQGLARAIRSGKLGFDDLKKVALSVLSEIAAQAVTSGIAALFGAGGSQGGKSSVAISSSSPRAIGFRQMPCLSVREIWLSTSRC